MSLRAGDLVEVRSAAEIAHTLDPAGMLDGLPFMPEMLAYCGRRLRVGKVAHKTCDTITKTGGRRMRDAVHLEGVRCDGSAHGGCQAACLIFWKTAWLKRVETVTGERVTAAQGAVEELRRALRVTGASEGDAAETRYVCQATEMLRATTPLRWWDLRQYVLDLWTGNVSGWEFVRVVAIAAFNAVQRWRGGRQYPFDSGSLPSSPPASPLGLAAGDLVRVRSREEIARTLDSRGKNRGLWFDAEMMPYCGGTYRAVQRVERIIDERTGRMILLPNDCWILDGVTCRGYLSRGRLFCPRAIYSYWREVWLERAGPELTERQAAPGPPQ